MRAEELALPIMRALVKRPRVADVVFRLDKWGNIVGPDRFTNPYPIYERMREWGPVSYSPFFQQWAVVGYDEAREVLNSPAFGVAPQMDLLLSVRPYSNLSDHTKAVLSKAVLFTDPPVHTRLRSLVNRAFTPKQMARLEPNVATLARANLVELLEGSSGTTAGAAPDLMAGFAAPLPINVIADLLGVPEDKWAWMARASEQIRELLDPFVVVDVAKIDASVDELSTYFSDLADERLADPQDDLITGLVQAETDGERLDRIELISMIAILMIAGHETTTGALGNAIVALADHPEERQMLVDQPDLWPNAVEELLRFDTTLQTDPRAALENADVAGVKIKRGQNLTVMLGAVNRDPRRWTDPNELRVDRENPAPLSFGHGIHHCIGAALARMELRIGLQTFLELFGDYTIDTKQVTWLTSLAFRRPTYLPVRPGGPGGPGGPST